MPELFRLTLDSFGGIPVLRLGGRLVFGQNLETIRDAVRRLQREEHQRLVVDVTEVESADSSGISALLEIRRIIGETGGRLVLLRPSERLRGALAILRVTSLFEIVDDETALTRRVEEWSARSSPG
jgi:anti-anti-sigma factor